MINYKIMKSKKRKHFLITNDNVYYYTNLYSNSYFAQNAEFRTVEEGKCYYVNDRYVLCCEPVSCYK